MLIHTFEPPGISELPKEFEDADHHLEICKTQSGNEFKTLVLANRNPVRSSEDRY
jgi:hypothetical protein